MIITSLNNWMLKGALEIYNWCGVALKDNSFPIHRIKLINKTKFVQNMHCNKPILIVMALSIAFIGNVFNKKINIV